MEKKELPVLIKSVSAECGEHGREENMMRLMMPGTLSERPEGKLLAYTETLQEDDGHQVTHQVRVLIREDRVTVLRKGPYGMMMVLQPGVPYQGTYHTPYGDMELEVYTTVLQMDVGESKGSIRMEYQLRVGGGEAMMRRMSYDYTLC